MKRKKAVHFRALRMMLVVLAAPVLAFCALGGARILANAPKSSDVIVVLGARVYPSGTPSPLLVMRLQTALALYRQEMATRIIVCGGKGGDEPVTEAAAMAAWLQDHDVPKAHIFLDETSADTVQNLENAHDIMKRQGFETAVVVTSGYHLPRAMMIAREKSLQATGAAAPSLWYLLPYNCSRELLAWGKHLGLKLLGKR